MQPQAPASSNYRDDYLQVIEEIARSHSCAELCMSTISIEAQAKAIKAMNPQQKKASFAFLAHAFYRLTFYDGCENSRLHFQKCCSTYCETHPQSLLRYFLKAPPSVQSMNLADPRILLVKRDELKALHEQFSNFAGTVSLDAATRLTYEVSWSETQGILLHFSKTERKIAFAFPRNALELSLLRYNIISRYIQSLPESNAQPAFLTTKKVMFVLTAAQLASGVGIFTAIMQGIAGGLAYLAIDTATAFKVGISRSHPNEVPFEKLTDEFDVGFDPKPSGYGHKLTPGQTSLTWGYLRLRATGKCYAFDLNQDMPISYDTLQELRSDLYLAFVADSITLKTIFMITKTLQKPLFKSRHPRKQLVDFWNSIFLESLIPICLSQFLKKSTKLISQIANECPKTVPIESLFQTNP